MEPDSELRQPNFFKPKQPGRRNVNLRLDRFFGCLDILWYDNQVSEAKPKGALRIIKKLCSHSKTYVAACNAVQKHVFF